VFGLYLNNTKDTFMSNDKKTDHDELEDDTILTPDFKGGNADHKGFNKRNILLAVGAVALIGTLFVNFTTIKKKDKTPEDIAKETTQNVQAARVDDAPGVGQLQSRYDNSPDKPNTPPQNVTDQHNAITTNQGIAKQNGQAQQPNPYLQPGNNGNPVGQLNQNGEYIVPAGSPNAKMVEEDRKVKLAQAREEAKLKYERDMAQRREEWQEKVRSGNLTFGGGPKAGAANAVSGAANDAIRALEDKKNLLLAQNNNVKPPAMPEIKIPSLGGDGDPTKQGDKQKYLDKDRSGMGYNILTKMYHPISPYQIMAGTIIPGTFITGINSDLPGQLTAQVRENVYDTVKGRYLLIPQGARFVGEYNNNITANQERLLIVWTRLIFPNGKSINLEGMPGVDLSGYAGSQDQVNHHFMSIASAAVLSSLMGAGVNIAAGNNEAGKASFGQLAAGGAATKMQSAGDRILDRFLTQPPTITIRPAQKFNVFVNKDIALQPYR
jgi:type IV secretory pathway VirB10-like protein